ncbi:NAD(P)/FAD-dependent oxidoreductase [Sphingosinicella microcystinivorans]|uniref:NAD(P)/FAD-dependent oxidoreductase n=1 Tax=Sphingosinicella microcystinivorans TaxID=335406 RepID=UPI0022F3CF91|nr:FAD-binding oxidoreductase [Sphingosinicella microcystinivorans]WBX85809.1 FAD-binding oxidoreductase [Sphingosinicella microcystinivorans]
MNARKPQPHAPSYYAATAHSQPSRPMLAGRRDADICVVGGGFSGVSTALALAERGYSVILLEQNRIGWGASGRNGGQVLAGWSGEHNLVKQLGDRASEFLSRTRYRGHEIIEQRIARYGIACDYAVGTATAALSTRYLHKLEAEYTALAAEGQAGHLELVDGGRIKQYIGSDLYCGGLIDSRGAHCHPLNLCIGEALAAESLGVQIFENSQVTGIEQKSGVMVSTFAGAVLASAVVLAGSAYHHLLPQQLGGYTLPAMTYVMATEPLESRFAKSLLPANHAICDTKEVLDYFRLSADNRLLWGGECSYSNRSAVDIRKILTPGMLRAFPQLAATRVEFTWSGAIDITLNRVPMIGRTGKALYHIQGFSGHGVNTSHIASEIVADAISDDLAPIDLLQEARHWRIPAADFIGNPMLALGMTYFRMRDRLGF